MVVAFFFSMIEDLLLSVLTSSSVYNDLISINLTARRSQNEYDYTTTFGPFFFSRLIKRAYTLCCEKWQYRYVHVCIVYLLYGKSTLWWCGTIFYYLYVRQKKNVYNIRLLFHERMNSINVVRCTWINASV